mmetsp:Transcript_73661/g.229117  ORF Transcript_73661/g.229117 Transcript_73661/m.229117 type:complete len:298 (+) Transcript_73661:1142-2035(+)
MRLMLSGWPGRTIPAVHDPHGEVSPIKCRAMELLDCPLCQLQRLELHLPCALWPARLAVREDGRVGDTTDRLAERPQGIGVRSGTQPSEEDLAPIGHLCTAWMRDRPVVRSLVHEPHRHGTSVEPFAVKLVHCLLRQSSALELGLSSTPGPSRLSVCEDGRKRHFADRLAEPAQRVRVSLRAEPADEDLPSVDYRRAFGHAWRTRSALLVHDAQGQPVTIELLAVQLFDGSLRKLDRRKLCLASPPSFAGLAVGEDCGEGHLTHALAEAAQGVAHGLWANATQEDLAAIDLRRAPPR